jgi:prepilin-type N-terminal cleavage/methylation domain-containing protein
MQVSTNTSSTGGTGTPVSRTTGFSLIELLLVLAIMLVVLFLSSDGYFRERARQRMKACAQNLAGQYVALQTYANDHDGRFPVLTNATSPSEPLSLLIPQYTTQTEFWICPASGDRALAPAKPFADRKISYAYYMGWRKSALPEAILSSDEQVDAGPKIAQQLAFSPDGKGPGSNHGKDGGNFLHADGSLGQSPSHASVAFPLPPDIKLLNPAR